MFGFYTQLALSLTLAVAVVGVVVFSYGLINYRRINAPMPSPLFEKAIRVLLILMAVLACLTAVVALVEGTGYVN